MRIHSQGTVLRWCAASRYLARLPGRGAEQYFSRLVSRVKPNGALALASVSYIGTTFAEIRLLQKFFDSSRGS